MTFPASVANLTKAVNEITAETNVPKSTLDAKVAQAEAEVPLAQAEQTAAEGYRDTAATHAADAATHLATVQANVTYQGIDAILAEKAVTAVDVFVYDTNLDSDGGAWRKRCQHTSWFNETLNTATRCARREFPAVAVIVAEANKITIYDGDDPDLPMWMVFNSSGWGGSNVADVIGTNYLGSAVTSISASNGIVAVGVNNDYSGVRLIKFPSDGAEFYRQTTHGIFNLGLVDRNLNVNTVKWTLQSSGFIVDETVNDVAMTVLPDAPIDPDTGLPVPTIVVATGGGVSVIRHDGTVTNDSTLSWNFNNTFAVVSGETVATNSGTNHFYLGNIRDGQFVHELEGSVPGGKLSQAVGGRSWLSGPFSEVFERGTFHVGHRYGVVTWTGLTDSKYDPRQRAMVRHTERTFATGWHPYDTVASFLSDTDDTDLVGSTLIDDGFDYEDTTALLAAGWTLGGDAAVGEITTAGSEVVISNADSSNNNFIYQNFTTVVGQPYTATITANQVGTQARVRIRNGDGNITFGFPANVIAMSNAVIGTFTLNFTALSELTSFAIGASNGTGTASFQDVKIEAAAADRSVKNKGLIVNGTITRSPVADGAELVAYSGFSASNYLEQPYNPDLDFGTGDFSIMGWAKNQQLYDTFFVRSDGSTTSTEFMLQTGADAAALRFYVGGLFITRTGVLPTIGWHHLVVLRESGTIKIYSNGVLVDSFANTASVTQVGATLTIGHASNSASPAGSDAFAGSLALWRISATAPTADQIRKIYEDERKLFQPGAQCTLYGTSDAVTALAHDPKTNLLHVGTSQGRSIFDGLVRVSNTTTPVGTAISAVNGLIVEE